MHPMAQTDRQTQGNGDSMTESAQWDPFSENAYFFAILRATCIGYKS